MMSMALRPCFLGLAFALLAHAPAAGQRTPERGADLLSFDFAAIAPDGTPVRDLRPEDLSLKLAGRQRDIRSLQLIDAVPVPDEPSRTVPPPFGTNGTAEMGRTFALIFDDDSFRPGRERALREAVDTLVSGLSPADRITVVTMPYGGVRVPLTTDHARVVTAVSQIVGRAPEGESGSELACRTRRTLESLTGFLETLGQREDRATVILVTAGLAAPRRDAPQMMAPGMCELPATFFAQVGAAAGAARAQFYIVHPGNAAERDQVVQRENIAGIGYLGSDNPVEGMEHLAGVTGGKMLYLGGSADSALGRVLRETAVYYRVTIDAQRNDRSGRSLPVELRVQRRGVELRSRPVITFHSPEPSLTTVASPSLRDMMGTTAVFRDLPLRAAAFPALRPDGTHIRMVALAEPMEPGVRLEALAAGLFDQNGKLAAHWLATAAELARAPLVGAMSVAAGAYRLRVAAIDDTGRTGTVDYEVQADVARTGPLELSAVILGLSRGGAFVPMMQFSDEPVAIAYLEMQGAPAGSAVSARLEIAEALNGPAIAALPLALEAAADGRYIARAAIPIAALAPGDYAVRALIGLEGHAVTRVTHTLRKAARTR